MRGLFEYYGVDAVLWEHLKIPRYRMIMESCEGTTISTIHESEVVRSSHPFFALTRDLHYHSQGEIA